MPKNIVNIGCVCLAGRGPIGVTGKKMNHSLYIKISLAIIIFGTITGISHNFANAQTNTPLVHWFADHEILDAQGRCANSLSQQYRFTSSNGTVQEPAIVEQWALGNGGDTNQSRVIYSTPDLPNNTNPIVTVRGSDAAARSGKCSLALRMLSNQETDNNPLSKRGIRVFKRNTSDSGNGVPFDSYYSAWFYLPNSGDQPYIVQDHRNSAGEVSTYGNWNIFQFKNFHSNKNKSGFANDFDAAVVSFAFKIKLNDHEFQILQKEAIECNGWRPCRTAIPGSATYASDTNINNRCFKASSTGGSESCEENAIIYQTSEPIIPIGRWFQIEAYITKSSLTNDGNRIKPDGRLAVWVDGKEVFHKANLQTIVHPMAAQHWSVNNYIQGDVSPLYPTIYVDDAQIKQGTPNRSEAQVRVSRPGPKCDNTDGTVLLQEAENGFISGNFRVLQDNAASGGQYVAVPKAFGSTTTLSESQIDYCFRVSQSGTYKIKGQVRAVDGGSNSFLIAVDDLPAAGYRWNTARSSIFTESYIGQSASDIFTVELSAGPHIVSIYNREAGTQLDKLELELVTEDLSLPSPVDGTTNCGTTPIGAASSVIEAEDGALTGMERGATSGVCGKHIVVAEGTFSAPTTGPNPNYLATYTVQLPASGLYKLRARLLAPDSGSNSFWVTINGGQLKAWEFDSSNTYETTTSGPNFNLGTSATVRIFGKEDGTRLDQFWFECVTGNCDQVSAASRSNSTDLHLLLPFVAGPQHSR